MTDTKPERGRLLGENWHDTIRELRAENERLRRRVAELEAERGGGGCVVTEL